VPEADKEVALTYLAVLRQHACIGQSCYFVWIELQFPRVGRFLLRNNIEELKRVFRPGEGSDQICGQRPEIMKQDGALLVPIGVQLNAPLLHQDAAEMLEWVKGIAGEIAFHLILLN